MKRLLPTVFAVLFFQSALLKSQVCNVNGNLMLFTNYDGGTLTINVDQNISNLKIGVCSYEAVRIVVTGAFAGNLTELRYAGYNSTNNNHCTGGVVPTTTVIGTGTAVVSIVNAPPATISNPNGYGSIICGYSCNNSTSQGGCNTVDQVEAYFLSVFPGSTIFAHRIQYNCWSGTYNISAGGNCCLPPALNPGSVSGSQTICAGQSPGAFTSVAPASGGSGAITYTWQSSTTSTNAGFSNISGANNTTLQPSAINVTTYYRRATSTPANSTVFSNVIAVTTLSNPAPVLASNVPVCAGSTLQLLASPAAQTYSWSGPASFLSGIQAPLIQNISQLHSGIYSLSVTYPNGCSRFNHTISVNVASVPTIVVSQSSGQICVGQQATLSATGGTSYAWQPNNSFQSTVVVSPAASTIYTVTANPNQCKSTETIAITVNPLPVVQAAAQPTLVCSGGTATLNAAGAVSYLWYPMVIPGSNVTVSPSSSLNSFTVLGTDINGCTSTVVVTVGTLTVPAIAVASDPATPCEGASFVMQASGASNFMWEPGSLLGNSVSVTAQANAVYTVTGVGPNGCASQTQVAVSVLPAPQITFTRKFQTTCPGQQNTLTAQGASSYSWHVSGSNTNAGILVSPTVTTAYSVTGTESNGCKTSAVTVATVEACTGINELSSADVSIFPNPSKGEVVFSVNENTVIDIYNQAGQRVMTVSVAAGNTKTIKLERGHYIAVFQKDGSAIPKRFLIE